MDQERGKTGAAATLEAPRTEPSGSYPAARGQRVLAARRRLRAAASALPWCLAASALVALGVWTAALDPRVAARIQQALRDQHIGSAEERLKEVRSYLPHDPAAALAAGEKLSDDLKAARTGDALFGSRREAQSLALNAALLLGDAEPAAAFAARVEPDERDLELRLLRLQALERTQHDAALSELQSLCRAFPQSQLLLSSLVEWTLREGRAEAALAAICASIESGARLDCPDRVALIDVEFRALDSLGRPVPLEYVIRAWNAPTRLALETVLPIEAVALELSAGPQFGGQVNQPRLLFRHLGRTHDIALSSLRRAPEPLEGRRREVWDLPEKLTHAIGAVLSFEVSLCLPASVEHALRSPELAHGLAKLDPTPRPAAMRELRRLALIAREAPAIRGARALQGGDEPQSGPNPTDTAQPQATPRR